MMMIAMKTEKLMIAVYSANRTIGVKCIVVLLLCACNLLSFARGEEDVTSRYELILLSLAESESIPDLRKEFRMGLEVVLDGNVISVGKLTHWGTLLSPVDEGEFESAKKFLKCDNTELRIIISWAILESLEISSVDFPEDVSPMWAGRPIGSNEHNLFSQFLFEKIKDGKIR